jgi:hypothetical protein
LKKVQLYNQLKTVDATRKKRLEHANFILDDTSLIKPLMDIVFMVDDIVSPKAAWVFEFVCAKDLSLLRPHMEYFTAHLTKVHLDSAVRPIAKVCLFLVDEHYTDPLENHTIELNLKQKESITEACFNWLIHDEKVAPKVYAMQCLFLLGHEFDWIHPELILILEKDYHHQTAGFKAKARHIMTALNKH